MDGAAICNVVGLIMNLAGVILLFFYVMPRRVRTGGYQVLLGNPPDQTAAKKERRFDLLSWAGLSLVVVGTLFRIAAPSRARMQHHDRAQRAFSLVECRNVLDDYFAG
jgi:hypothetical protein